MTNLSVKSTLFSFNNSNNEYGKAFDYLNYWGMLEFSDGAFYKFITKIIGAGCDSPGDFNGIEILSPTHTFFFSIGHKNNTNL